MEHTPWHSYGVSLAIRDHNSVTCHPTQVNTPRLNPSQTGPYSIYLSRRDGRQSWPRWLVTCLPVRTHPTTNRDQCRWTTLIKANVLTTTLCSHPWLIDWFTNTPPIRTDKSSWPGEDISDVIPLTNAHHLLDLAVLAAMSPALVLLRPRSLVTVCKLVTGSRWWIDGCCKLEAGIRSLLTDDPNSVQTDPNEFTHWTLPRWWK